MVAASSLPAGVHDLPAADYHADRLRPEPTLSSTLARLILRQSLLHAWTAHPRLNPDWQPRDTEAFDFGRAAHRVILGAGSEYAVWPEGMLSADGGARTKEARAWAAEQREAGVTPIKPEADARMEAMAAVMRQALRDLSLEIDRGRSELVALGEVDGVWVRALLDNAPERPLPRLGPVLIDFKTCEDASPEACVNAVRGYGYDVQAAHYLAAWEAATGERRTFLFLFQEKAPPHEVCAVVLLDEPGHSEDWMLAARDKAATARFLWGEALSTRRWPGYRRELHLLGAPPWHNTKWDESALRADVAARRPSLDTLHRAHRWQSPEGLRA